MIYATKKEAVTALREAVKAGLFEAGTRELYGTRVDGVDQYEIREKAEPAKPHVAVEIKFKTRDEAVAHLEANGLTDTHQPYGPSKAKTYTIRAKDGIEPVEKPAKATKGKASPKKGKPAAPVANDTLGPCGIIRSFMQAAPAGTTHADAKAALIALGLNRATVSIQLKRQGWF